MKTRFATLTLAVLGGLGMMAAPAIGDAANIGYSYSGGYSAGIPGAITSLGHTPVPIATIDAASLSGLKALVLASCGAQPLLNAPNAALDAGTHVDDRLLVPLRDLVEALDRLLELGRLGLQITAGAPGISGPGGTLTATSLDRIPAGGGGYYNMVRYHPRASLPAGAARRHTSKVSG